MLLTFPNDGRTLSFSILLNVMAVIYLINPEILQYVYRAAYICLYTPDTFCPNAVVLVVVRCRLIIKALQHDDCDDDKEEEEEDGQEKI